MLILFHSERSHAHDDRVVVPIIPPEYLSASTFLDEPDLAVHGERPMIEVEDFQFHPVDRRVIDRRENMIEDEAYRLGAQTTTAAACRQRYSKRAAAIVGGPNR